MIGVFSGTGAVLHADVEEALRKLGLRYTRIDDGFNLEGINVLIVPGGYTMDMWEPFYKNRRRIYDFLDEGGRYLGICAGAYLAPETVVLRKGRLPGLGIIDVENVRKNGAMMVEVNLCPHPLTRGLPPRLRVWYQNGPHMIPKEGDSIATFDDGLSAIVGNGKVTLFSIHPEGSMDNGVHPTKESLELMRRILSM